MNELTKEVASLFESIKHFDDSGVEFWSARELAPYLGYKRWENFLEVLEKAKQACKSSVGTILNDFRDVTKIVKAGFIEKPAQDIELTRYACYLVAQNGDPRKPEIAQAEEKIRREHIKGKDKANEAHYEVGKKVRKAIADIGGTMPEDLPTAESIKQVEAKQRNLLEE